MNERIELESTHRAPIKEQRAAVQAKIAELRERIPGLREQAAQRAAQAAQAAADAVMAGEEIIPGDPDNTALEITGIETAIVGLEAQYAALDAEFREALRVDLYTWAGRLKFVADPLVARVQEIEAEARDIRKYLRYLASRQETMCSVWRKDDYPMPTPPMGVIPPRFLEN